MKLNVRQYQKTTHRRVIIITALCMAFIAIGLTIFFNLSNVDRSLADDRKNDSLKEFVIGEQEYTVEKSLPAPVISNSLPESSDMQLVRKVKEVSTVTKTSN